MSPRTLPMQPTGQDAFAGARAACNQQVRQRRKIELQQRRIPATHIQIRNRPAIHPRPGAVHMGIGDQMEYFHNNGYGTFTRASEIRPT